jgi:hypothetical protein
MELSAMRLLSTGVFLTVLLSVSNAWQITDSQVTKGQKNYVKNAGNDEFTASQGHTL